MKRVTAGLGKRGGGNSPDPKIKGPHHKVQHGTNWYINNTLYKLHSSKLIQSDFLLFYNLCKALNIWLLISKFLTHIENNVKSSQGFVYMLLTAVIKNYIIAQIFSSIFFFIFFSTYPNIYIMVFQKQVLWNSVSFTASNRKHTAFWHIHTSKYIRSFLHYRYWHIISS